MPPRSNKLWDIFLFLLEILYISCAVSGLETHDCTPAPLPPPYPVVDSWALVTLPNFLRCTVISDEE